MNRQLFLVRHFESEANHGLQTNDPYEIPLTARGINDSKKFANSFAAKPDLIVASPMSRALESARPFCERFYSVPFEVWDETREFVFLRFDRPTTPDERAPYVKEYFNRCDPDELNPGDGCESFRQLLDRASQFHARIKTSHSKPVVFSHGFFMHTFVYLMSNGFPDCSQYIMHKIYEVSKRPFTNGQVIAVSLD